MAIEQGNIVTDVAILPDGSRMFSGMITGDSRHYYADGPADVFMWDTTTGRLIRRFRGCEVMTKGVALSPDGCLVLAAGAKAAPKGVKQEMGLVAWDVDTAKPIWTVDQRRHADGHLCNRRYCVLQQLAIRCANGKENCGDS